MKVFTLGSINMDLVVKSPYCPKAGETIKGSGFMTNPGGKGANQAVAASKLGSESVMIGCVGDAFGDELKNTLNSYNVSTKYVKKLENVSSGIAVIIITDSNNRIIIDPGSNGLIDNELIDEALEESNAGDYLIAQLEIEQDKVFYGFKKAHEKGLKTVFNPSPSSELKYDILKYTDYIIVNETEAEFYSGVELIDDDSLIKCSDELKKLGVKNVIITLGEKGSIGIFEDEVVRVEPCLVEAVDTTGAGDTYLGAFVAAISRGMEYSEAMAFASKASSLTCTKLGAQQAIPYLKDIE